MSDRPYGQINGLPERVAAWVGRMKYDKTLPWVGSGLVSDMEAVVRLLSLEEFGTWLRTHPDDELQRWSSEVLEASRERDSLAATIDEHLPAGSMTYEGDVVAAGKFMADVRGVLVSCGALTTDDTETDIPALLRALLQ